MKTSKIKKVLIALDYDPTAQKVAESGFSIAKAMGAKVVLLHVIADALYYSSLDYSPIMGFNGFMDMGPSQLNNPDRLIEASQHFLEKSKQYLGDETIETIIREGNLADSILTAAKNVHADIIVLGSHSKKWLENIVMGSVTEKVLRHTTLPLFIIPTKRPD
ncbi:MAG: universal stress protein [Bacteroidota bacterium]